MAGGQPDLPSVGRIARADDRITRAALGKMEIVTTYRRAVYLPAGGKGQCVVISVRGEIGPDGQRAWYADPRCSEVIKGATFWKLLKPGEPEPNADAVRARRRSVRSRKWRATRAANKAAAACEHCGK